VASSRTGKRTRGPNQGTPWKRRPEEGLSVLRLPVDVTDSVQRHRVEAMFSVTYSMKRALQRDARERCRAYKAAHHERRRDPAALRARLGLSREALERAAYEHLNAALPYAVSGRQDVRSESTVHSARDGSFVAEKGPTLDLVAVARRTVGWASFRTLNETGMRPTTSERVRTRANLYRDWVERASTQLRDSS
jgi:hypothetical protein